MLYIQRTVFGLLFLMPQFWSVILPERWTSVPITPMITPTHLQEWNYPFPNNPKCTLPFIYQPSIDRCCYPVFNCEPGSGIEFCSVDRGKDRCVKCKNSSKQYYLVHSFDGIIATCFSTNESDELQSRCATEALEGTLIPSRYYTPSCGLRCECNVNGCHYGIDPCKCIEKHDKCKSNQQMNRLTGDEQAHAHLGLVFVSSPSLPEIKLDPMHKTVSYREFYNCEACPWYGYKLTEDCGACLVNESLLLSGPSPTTNVLGPPTPNVTVPPTPNVTVPQTPSMTVPPTPNVAVMVTTMEGNFTKLITEETINQTTTALLPESVNDTTIRWVMIIGGVVIVVCFIAGMALMYLFQKRNFCKISGASSLQYTSITQVPPIDVANQGPSAEYQEVSETSDLMNNSETNILQSNELIRGQPVSNNNSHLVSHEVEDHMDSPKSSKSGNHLGIHGRINERNQSASSNSASSENLSDSRERTHQIDDSDQTSLFISSPPVEKGQSWRFPNNSVSDNDSITFEETFLGYDNVAQNTVPQAICTREVAKRTNDNTSIIPVKEFIRLQPLISRVTRGPDLQTPNHEGGICCEDSKIPNVEPRVPSEESPHACPQYLTKSWSPTTAGNRSTFRPFLNRLISSPTDRPTAKVTPMRQESRSQRQDAVTLESDDNMSTGSSTDISMSYGVVHIHGAELSSDESLESSIPSLNSCFEDNPPSYSYSTNLPNTASHTVGKTEPKRPGDLKSATKNGSQIQKMANLSRGEPDGTSRPSDYQKNRVREPWHEVSETEVKVPVESEETDPKTLLSSTQVGDRTESERQDSDSEDHSEKIVLKINQTEDLVKLRDICEGLVFPASLCDAAENSSNEVQGKTLRRDFKAMEANASDKERNQRNVPLHNDDQVQYNNCSFSSELEDEENNLNITTRSKCNTEETCHSYSSLQDKEDIQIETKGVEDSGKDGIDSKSSLEEIVKEANDSFNDTDPDVEESSSDQTSSHSDDDGVCSNGDAELNRELQQPSQGQNDLQNEFNSSSLSVNSDESGIGIEERTIKTVQGS